MMQQVYVRVRQGGNAAARCASPPPVLHLLPCEVMSGELCFER
jgi:hypothetical protein